MNIKKIEEGFRLILEGTGEDLDRPGIKETPKRAARLWAKRNFGYNTKLKVMTSEERNNKDDHGDVIPITIFPAMSSGLLVRKVKFDSMCEHHIVDIKGECWVGIIPGDKILGMNKIDKIVKWYGARLQIQENFTKQIITWIEDHIHPRGVIVIVRADHQCANLQGDEGNFTTAEISGVFKEDASAKEEFLKLIDINN